MENARTKTKLKTRKVIAAAAVIIIIAALVFFAFKSESAPKESIINEVVLERILNMSELSTVEAIYNGVARVANPDDPQKINYYVSYDATVKAGIDFEELKNSIEIDNDNKIVSVTLPEIKITEIIVPIESMDYIFINKKANTGSVYKEAYKQCIADVQNKSSNESEILELAEQNAKNIVEALLRPFINSLDSEYRLQIN